MKASADRAAAEAAQEDRDPQEGVEQLGRTGCQNAAFLIVGYHPSHDGCLDAQVEEHDADGEAEGALPEEAECVLFLLRAGIGHAVHLHECRSEDGQDQQGQDDTDCDPPADPVKAGTGKRDEGSSDCPDGEKAVQGVQRG